jgi:hypothetical protein
MKKLIAALLLLPSFAFAGGNIQLGGHRDIDAHSDGSAATLSANYKCDKHNVAAHFEAYQIESDYDQYTLAIGYAVKTENASFAASIGARSFEAGDVDETETIVKLDTQYKPLYLEVVAGDGIEDTRAGLRIEQGHFGVDIGYRRNKVDTDELQLDITGLELKVGYVF